MKASTDRRLTKLTNILWVILGVALILLGLLGVVPSFYKSAYQHNIYDRNQVERITGMSFTEKEKDFFGMKCIELVKKDRTDTYFNGLNYYLFPNTKSAELALKTIATNGYFCDGSIVTTDDSAEGYVYGVCDADIQEYWYRSGNLIVVAEAVYSAWGTPEDIEEYKEESQKEHDALEYYKEWLPTVFNADK